MKYFIFLYLTLSVIPVYSQTQFIAHRGASYLAPENTVKSVELAWDLGSDAVEIDVQLTVDKRIMVIHDKDTRRTCQGKNFQIASSPSELLRDMDAGTFKDEKYKGEKIPFLSEITGLTPEGKKLVLNIECGTEILPDLKRVLKESGKTEQIIFTSPYWQTIVAAKDSFPQNACFWLTSEKHEMQKKLAEVRQAGLDGVSLSYSLINDKILAMVKEQKLQLIVRTVNDPREAGQLIALGIDKIMTDRPRWLKSHLSGIR